MTVMTLWRIFTPTKNRRDEQDKMARLEQAERDLKALQDRAEKAIEILDARHRRNHWRESVEQMIQGAL